MRTAQLAWPRWSAGGATALRSSSINTAGSGAALSVAVPAGTQAGDKLFVLVNANGNVTIADNNGANPLTVDAAVNNLQLATQGMTTSLYLKTVTSGDLTAWGGTLQFATTAGGRWTVIAVAVANPKASFFDVTPVTDTNDAGAVVSIAPDITTLTANAIHIACACVDGGSTGITAPAGYTTAQNGGNEAAAVCSKVIATAGATGAQVFALDSFEGSIAISFAIKTV